jgi:hypothetical protein
MMVANSAEVLASPTGVLPTGTTVLQVPIGVAAAAAHHATTAPQTKAEIIALLLAHRKKLDVKDSAAAGGDGANIVEIPDDKRSAGASQVPATGMPATSAVAPTSITALSKTPATALSSSLLNTPSAGTGGQSSAATSSNPSTIGSTATAPPGALVAASLSSSSAIVPAVHPPELTQTERTDSVTKTVRIENFPALAAKHKQRKFFVASSFHALAHNW